MCAWWGTVGLSACLFGYGHFVDVAKTKSPGFSYPKRKLTLQMATLGKHLLLGEAVSAKPISPHLLTNPDDLNSDPHMA